ncbi:hypothetical protein HGP16_06140 [Rhizobium sp. P40RR-XXII]|uniref:hypothetical protein n=1 Tax=unclassified Rhizobium TaxID=2613769 RepID=UPI00145710C4|nr:MULTISPECIES: hypothetical protein [unclassified Rhizobium]NLR83718.1 hypothetical protein [Rhizobium sp. P28RR-XV]NLS16138.1 hypothetical protein [Rhizobium sp. P40RR-XXII]
MTLPMQGKSLCPPREGVSLTTFDVTPRQANGSAGSVMGYDNGRTNAGLDIIASYARNCGKQPRLNAMGTVFAKDDSVSCAIRENIRESDGVHASAVIGPNGAKEIDCYV